MKTTIKILILAIAALAIFNGQAFADTKTVICDTSADPLQDTAGLSATAIFEWDILAPYTLKITLENTSGSVPAGFSNADQLLTGISFDLEGVNIISGSAVLAAGAQTVNFDNVTAQLSDGNDVSGEWGYGNTGTTGMMTNIVSGNMSHTTAFGTVNLDGPNVLDGPQGGLIADPMLVDLGGLGAIQNSICVTLQLDAPLQNMDWLDNNGVVAEFGSDAAFLVPEPATILLLGLPMITLLRKKK